MKIKILFFAGLREKTGTKETTLEFNSSYVSLLEVIRQLIRRYELLAEIFFPKLPSDRIDEYLGNEADDYLTRVKFARNRKIISNPRPEFHLEDGDTLAIFLPLLGG